MVRKKSNETYFFHGFVYLCVKQKFLFSKITRLSVIFSLKGSIFYYLYIYVYNLPYRYMSRDIGTLQ